MPRKRRASTKTPLSIWLQELLSKRGITQRSLAKIAGVSPSVVNSWAHGAFPSEAVDKVKKLANHFNQSLTTVLTGEPDQLTPGPESLPKAGGLTKEAKQGSADLLRFKSRKASTSTDRHSRAPRRKPDVR